MNLETVDYGWIVTKFKKDGIEVVFGNVGKITGRAFESAKHIIAHQMHIEQIKLRNEQERAQKKETPSDPYQMEMM